MSELDIVEPLVDSQIDDDTVIPRVRCPSCDSENTTFIDVSVWSGRFISKCLECSYLFKEA
jgi:hypothetical protein